MVMAAFIGDERRRLSEKEIRRLEGVLAKARKGAR